MTMGPRDWRKHVLDQTSGITGDAIAVTLEGDRLVVSVSGEIDCSNANAVAQAVSASPTEGQLQVVIDIAAVEFLDSSFLRTVVLCHQRLAEQGLTVTVRNPSEQARKLFELTRLDNLLE